MEAPKPPVPTPEVVCWWNLDEHDVLNPSPDMPNFVVIDVDQIAQQPDINLQGELYWQLEERRRAMGRVSIPMVFWPSGRLSHVWRGSITDHPAVGREG